jgi:hypothetical protein
MHVATRPLVPEKTGTSVSVRTGLLRPAGMWPGRTEIFRRREPNTHALSVKVGSVLPVFRRVVGRAHAIHAAVQCITPQTPAVFLALVANDHRAFFAETERGDDPLEVEA